VRHIRYLRYVVRHKWFVYQAGRKLGLGRRQLLVHDLSKFSRAEWGPYVRWFMDPPGPNKTWHQQAKDFRHDAEAQRRKAAFDRAWEHHWSNNPHHWEWWAKRSIGGSCPSEMTDGCRREMLADWRGAGLAQGKPDTRAWYEANKGRMQLHPETRAWIESALAEGD
jgi:hypothetical protein